MKVIIEASQEEFDAKRPALLKALGGGAPKALQPRRAVIRAQNEMMDHWDARYKAMIEAIKGDIDAVLAEG